MTIAGARRLTGGARRRAGRFPRSYAGARYYHSQTGRFTSPDEPIYIDPLNPQTWNLYQYALNNPLRWIDPTGHVEQCAEPRPDGFRSGVVADGG